LIFFFKQTRNLFIAKIYELAANDKVMI